MPNGILEVENACSGLRSLIALTAVGVIFAYFLPVSFIKKGILALTSIPIAVGANLIRIVILVLVSYLYSPGASAFKIADFTTGYSIYLIALLGLYIVSRGALAWERRQMANSVLK